MSSLSESDWSRIARYLAGDCSPEEGIAIERWIAAQPSRAAEVARVRRLWDAKGGSNGVRWPSAAMWEHIDATIVKQTTSKPGHRRFFNRMKMGAAAAIALLAVIVALGRVNVGETLPPHTYVTTIGQLAKVNLPDGSYVTLAPKSRLTVASDFGEQARIVTLVGEAYFDVTDGRRAPFIVRTGPISTRVLGTTFTVRRYLEDSMSYIAVTSGKVTTGGRGATRTLGAGTVAWFTDSTVVVTNSRDSALLTAWRDGRLVFNNVPIPNLVTALGRWYGYKFRVADTTLNRMSVTAQFRASSLSETLLILQDLLDANVTMRDSIITFVPRKRAAQPITKRAARTAFSTHTELGR
jgi:transmembrane sensor